MVAPIAAQTRMNPPLRRPASSTSAPGASNDASIPTGAATDIFIDVAEDAGIDFVHFNGMSGEFYICEVKCAGGGLFDYDNDGDLDVYLIQGSMLGPGKTLADARFPPKGPTAARGPGVSE